MSAAASWNGRTAVIGDVGGHHDALVGELRRLGADPDTGRLPDDLRVVQVGDLVHRGPDSAAVVELVDAYLTEQPDQWVQLVGNHEGLYVFRRNFDWPEKLDSSAVKTLRRWWGSGLMRVAAAVTDADRDYLVTHAGVTSYFWRDVLREPATAADAADALATVAAQDESMIFRPGQMLGGDEPDRRAGPVWATAGGELVPSWLDQALPFSQVHGHSSVIDWATGRMRADDSVVERTTIDEARRQTTTTLMGGVIIGVDPDHADDAAGAWRAWETRA